MACDFLYRWGDLDYELLYPIYYHFIFATANDRRQYCLVSHCEMVFSLDCQASLQLLRHSVQNSGIFVSAHEVNQN